MDHLKKFKRKRLWKDVTFTFSKWALKDCVIQHSWGKIKTWQMSVGLSVPWSTTFKFFFAIFHQEQWAINISLSLAKCQCMLCNIAAKNLPNKEKEHIQRIFNWPSERPLWPTKTKYPANPMWSFFHCEISHNKSTTSFAAFSLFNLDKGIKYFLFLCYCFCL